MKCNEKRTRVEGNLSTCNVFEICGKPALLHRDIGYRKVTDPEDHGKASGMESILIPGSSRGHPF
jgi:hypothetical protein